MSQVSNTSFTTTVSSNAMAVVDYLSKSMMSALPFIVCAALFRTVASLWAKACLVYGLPIPKSIACFTAGCITLAITFCPSILVGPLPASSVARSSWA